MSVIFRASPEALEHLRATGPRMATVIDQLGPLERELEPDLFVGIVKNIVGQQVSNAALATIWGRLQDAAGGSVTPESVTQLGEEGLRAVGLSGRKASYVLGVADEVLSGRLDLDELASLSDEDVIERLTQLKGVGRWTAEMLLIFSLGRPDVLSYDDLALQRGMRMVHRHRAITPELFRRYARKAGPYGSTAALYYWAVAGGAVPELTDPGAPRTPKRRAPEASSEAVRHSMQGNKGKDTKPELLVRERLREAGLTGYRLQWKKAPGRPDIAWPGKKCAIFVNGCFWHRCPHCNPRMPRTHPEYWQEKFTRNQERDARNLAALEADGWTVHVIWECELKRDKRDETFAELLPQLARELGKEESFTLDETIEPDDR